MKTEIKTSAFCGLSRSEDFQKWLEVTAPDLHEDLLTVVHTARGCRANSNKMMDIYFELNNRGKEPYLITFLKRRFPWVIKEDRGLLKKEQIKEVKINQQIQRAQITKDWASVNKHAVFQSYRPDILAFPQKFIIIDDPNALYDRVQKFVQNKLAVDYIIIEDHAYIEYFDMKYAAVVDKIPRENRDIYKYRWKMQHSDDQ
jgi:hypothetical protein